MSADPYLTTYSDPDGEPIAGEFTFVTGTEWFEGCDEPVRLVRRTFVRFEEEVGTFYPPGTDTICGECGGDGETVHYSTDAPPILTVCPSCNGTGNGLNREGFVADPERAVQA